MTPLSPCQAHGCAACCYDTEMPLTGEDIARLQALGHDAAAFVTWTEQGTAQLATVDAAAGLPALDASASRADPPSADLASAALDEHSASPRSPPASSTGKPCFFLKENKCSVYADRPAGCRIYPLVLNERSRLMRDEDCPHRAEFPLDASAKRRIQRVVSNLARRP